MIIFGTPKNYDFHPEYWNICIQGGTLDEVAIHFVGPSSERILILYDATVSSCRAFGDRGLEVNFAADEASERTIPLEKSAGRLRGMKPHTSVVPYLTTGFGR